MYKRYSLAEEARKLGINVDTLKRRYEQERERKKDEKALYELNRERWGPGWNNHANARHRKV